MSAQRAACAGRLLYRDRHLATERPWRLITPDGDELVLCSASCVLEVVCDPGMLTERQPAPAPPGRRWAVIR